MQGCHKDLHKLFKKCHGEEYYRIKNSWVVILTIQEAIWWVTKVSSFWSKIKGEEIKNSIPTRVVTKSKILPWATHDGKARIRKLVKLESGGIGIKNSGDEIKARITGKTVERIGTEI